MVHLLPHWNWQEGKLVRVCAMTNCDTAQLFINGIAQEKKKVVRRRAEWEVAYEPGVIRVEAFKDGRTLMDEVRTTGMPAKLEVVDAAPEKDFDSAIINVRLQDEQGLNVPGREHDRMIHFHVIKGELIGSGNGDPNGIQPDVTPDISTFCGRCQAIVRPDASGHVHVVIRSEGMEGAVYVR